MRTSEQIAEIAKALAQAQGKIKPSEKNSLNPHFKSKFSNITSVWESIREPMAQHEICVLQDITTSDIGLSVVTRLVHSSGQWIEFGPLVMPLIKRDPQSIGSITSYAKRYAICAAIGVVSTSDDDDAESVMNRNQMKAPEQIQLVTKEHVEELKKLLNLCSKSYRDDVYSKLKDNFSITDLQKLPIQLYNRIRSSAEQRIIDNNIIEESSIDEDVNG